ncbi:hypothetical protein ACWDV4_01345 [Micromonospora sp. NPDC003197]
MRRDEDEDRRQFSEYFAARREAVRHTAYLICGDWHWVDDLAGSFLFFSGVYRSHPLPKTGSMSFSIFRSVPLGMSHDSAPIRPRVAAYRFCSSVGRLMSAAHSL